MSALCACGSVRRQGLSAYVVRQVQQIEGKFAVPTTLTAEEIAVRLVLTLLSGALIGVNRSEHGTSAGLRTTILVCLAASASMLQVNLLLGLAGRHPDSFVMLDLMRLPLGVLTGMGFIGGGAILRRGNIVMGVTTAATLWFVTVMGLCFGAGQIGLGLTLTAIGCFVLWFLKWAERWIPQDRRASLSVLAGEDGPDEAEIRRRVTASGFQVVACTVTYFEPRRQRSLHCELQWRGTSAEAPTPPFVAELAKRPGTLRLRWRP